FSTPPPPTSTPFPYTTLFRSFVHFDRETIRAGFDFVLLGHQRQILLEVGQRLVPRAFVERFDIAHAHPRENLVTLLHFVDDPTRSEEHTSELQSLRQLVCRLL